MNMILESKNTHKYNKNSLTYAGLLNQYNLEICALFIPNKNHISNKTLSYQQNPTS